MPSASQPVEIPPELDSRYRHVELEVVPRDMSVVQAIVAVLVIVAGTVGLGVGVGLWVHLGAGIAAASLVVIIVGVLIGWQK